MGRKKKVKKKVVKKSKPIVPAVPPVDFKDVDYQIRLIDHELSRRKREQGIKYYVPNPIQLRAHRSMAREIFYMGSNRSGKTMYAVAELVINAIGWYPEWYPNDKKLNRPVKIRVISPKFKEGIQDVIEPKIMSLMPRENILRMNRASQGHLLGMEVSWKNGQGISTIAFMSQDQDAMAFEGTDSDLVVCDEPFPRSIYVAVMRGLLDRGGRLICAYTSLHHAWMKELTDKADGSYRDFFVADIMDNRFDIKGQRILSDKFIKEFESIISEDEKEMRLHGRYYHLSGLVYKELDPIVHIADKLPERFITWAVLDPHDRNPHWMIWAAVEPEGDIYIYRELIKSCNLYDLARDIRAVERDMTIHTRLIDPNFGRKPDSVGANTTVIDQLRKHGVDFLEAIDDDEAGVTAVREYLRYDKSKPIGCTNRPKLYFLRNACPETQKAMFNLQYKDWARQQDEKEKNEAIMEKYSHGSDCIRYLSVARPQYKRFKAHEGNDEKIY